jgi:hypothetical protein
VAGVQVDNEGEKTGKKKRRRKKIRRRGTSTNFTLFYFIFIQDGDDHHDGHHDHGHHGADVGGDVHLELDAEEIDDMSVDGGSEHEPQSEYTSADDLPHGHGKKDQLSLNISLQVPLCPKSPRKKTTKNSTKIGSSPSESSNSSSSDDNDDEHFMHIEAMQDVAMPEDHDDALYEGAPLSRVQSFIINRLVFDRLKMTRQAKDTVLKLVNLHCRQEDNTAFTTLHTFESYLGPGEDRYSTIHEYCSQCDHLFLADEQACPNDQNPRRNGNKKKTFFVEFNLEVELRTRVKDPRFWNLAQHPFTRQHTPGNIDDVYDGSLYPPNTVPGELTCIGSTDGIKVFKTNHSDLWPVMLVIQELPPSIR